MARVHPFGVLLAIIVLEFSLVQSTSKKCYWSDTNCLTKAAKNIHKAHLGGTKSPIDPLFAEKLNQDFETLNYDLSNITLTGLRNCDVISMKFDGHELLAYEYSLHCPKLVMDFTFEAIGLLNEVALDGVGLGTETTDNCFITLKGNSEVFVSKKDNEPRLVLKDVRVKTNMEGKYIFESNKLIRGEKTNFDLAIAYINNFVAERENTIEYPSLNHFMTLYVEELNRFLRDTPLEEALST